MKKNLKKTYYAYHIKIIKKREKNKIKKNVCVFQLFPIHIVDFLF